MRDRTLSSSERDLYFERGVTPSAQGPSQVAVRVTARWSLLLKKLHGQGSIQLSPFAMLRESKFTRLRGANFQFFNRWAYKFDVNDNHVSRANTNLARLTVRLMAKREKERKIAVLGRWARLIRMALSS